MAFVGADLDEEIYMHQPQGYFRLLQIMSQFNDLRLTKTSRKMVLHLRKFPFSLKQCSHDWYGTFKDFVISIEFMELRVDGGLFVLDDMDQGIVVAAVVRSVYDLLMIANKGSIGQMKD